MDILYKEEFWFTIATIITAFIIYYLSYNKKSEKNFLLKLFKDNQKLSLLIQKKLENFIVQYNAENYILFRNPDISCGYYIELMKTEYEKNLSDSVFEIINNKKLTKPEIRSIIDSLSEQNKALRLLDINLNLFIQQVGQER